MGKTATCQQLKKLLHSCVFLDGDWCWDAHPFVVTDETKAMVIDNICHLLNNFITCTAYQNIVFCWVMHQQDIVDNLLSKLDLTECNVKVISLVCDQDTLKSRLQQDIDNAKRTADVVNKAIERLPLYQQMNTTIIDTTNMNTHEVAQKIAVL